MQIYYNNSNNNELKFSANNSITIPAECFEWHNLCPVASNRCLAEIPSSQND